MAPQSQPPRLSMLTAPGPGAIGIILVHGDGAADLVEQYCGQRPQRRSRLARLGELDEGIVVALREDWVQIMPHGGVRLMQRIIGELQCLGADVERGAEARMLYPEAPTPMHAHMLLALSRSASPAAIDHLLAQPRRWSEAMDANAIDWLKVLRDSAALDHLMVPPRVVVVGPANVGKSTLTNLLAGRAASIVADLPGTTRDWVGACVQLPASIGDLTVHWLDTPGLRDSDDPIEQQAIALARRIIDTADVLVAMRDDEQDWPSLNRPADLFVVNKIDRPAAAEVHHQCPMALAISAHSGQGVAELIDAIAAALGLGQVEPGALWAFCPALRATAQAPSTLARLLGR